MVHDEEGDCEDEDHRPPRQVSNQQMQVRNDKTYAAHNGKNIQNREANKHTPHTHIHTYIYIYIKMYVCGCNPTHGLTK